MENLKFTIMELAEAIFFEAFLVDGDPNLFVFVACEEVLADSDLLKGVKKSVLFLK